MFNKVIMSSLFILSIFSTGCVRTGEGTMNAQKIAKSSFLNDKTIKSARESVKKINLGDFRQLVNQTSVDVVYEDGDPEVIITGPEDRIDKIRILQKGNSLRIGAENGKNSLDKVKVTVRGKELNQIDIEGSGDFNASAITATALTVNSRGSGDVEIGKIDSSSVKLLVYGSGDLLVSTLFAASVQTNVMGSGDVIVNNTEATNVKSVIQGSGDTKLRHLTSVNVDISVQGSGDVSCPDLNVRTLNAAVYGSGDIDCGGTATVANLATYGTGDIYIGKLKAARLNKSGRNW